MLKDQYRYSKSLSVNPWFQSPEPMKFSPGKGESPWLRTPDLQHCFVCIYCILNWQVFYAAAKIFLSLNGSTSNRRVAGFSGGMASSIYRLRQTSGMERRMHGIHEPCVHCICRARSTTTTTTTSDLYPHRPWWASSTRRKIHSLTPWLFIQHL